MLGRRGINLCRLLQVLRPNIEPVIYFAGGNEMKLTIKQLSKLTKLSIPTLRVYVSRQKLGTKIGNKRVFSQSDVQKLLKASKKSRAERRVKAPTNRAVAKNKSLKPQPVRTSAAKQNANNAKSGTPTVKSTGPSFWARLFGGRKQKQKISLFDARARK